MKVQELKITPEKALELLSSNTRNRAMQQKQVLYLADQMLRGKWIPNGEPIQISIDGVMLNGQHRLAAIVKSNTAQQLLLVTDVDPCAFGTYDVGKKRTAGDVFSVNGIENSYPLASMVRKYCGVNLGIVDADKTGSANTKLSIVDIYDKYKDNPRLFSDILKKASSCYRRLKILHTSEVGAFMAYLIIDKGHEEDVVYSFFRQLCFSENVENQSINVLRDKLVNSSITGFKMTFRYKRALLTKTWNSFVVGKEMKTVFFNEGRETYPEFI